MTYVLLGFIIGQNLSLFIYVKAIRERMIRIQENQRG